MKGSENVAKETEVKEGRGQGIYIWGKQEEGDMEKRRRLMHVGCLFQKGRAREQGMSPLQMSHAAPIEHSPTLQDPG